MFRSACDFLASKAGLDSGADSPSEEDSSKENSLINGQSQFSSSTATKGSPVVGTPWGHTLTPRSSGSMHSPGTALPHRLVLNGSGSSVATPKSNVPWNDLSFAAEVVSPGFASRVVREAQAHNPRSPVEPRRQYPTAQERYVRAGVLPNVCLGGRTKAVLTPRRTPTSPLLPLGRSSSSTFSSSLSSDFLTSTTPRMPDIRSVASVLEPTSSSNECVRDPTSVQAVVAALQQAQVGKGIKRGSCYMEPEDLSKRQKCTTTGSIVSTAMPINYSRDYLEDGQNCGSNGTTGGGGEKRALDLSPSAQGSPQQLSPENKKRCVLDPMVASFSSSKHIIDLGIIQANGRDTPFSMYDSRRDTDSESNPSVESAQSKNSEQSLHQQTSEATGGESCVISPGPSERDPSDRSGSHTPQSTRGDSSNGSGGGGGGGNGGTANTSRTSTPRNPTPPRPTHVISLEAYKTEKAKSQQRLKKMLGMLFHVKEGEEPRQSKSGESTPVSGSAFTLVTPTSVTASVTSSLTLSSTPVATSGTLETTVSSISTPGTGGFGTLLSSNSSLKTKTTEESVSLLSDGITQKPSEGTKNEVSASFTFSLKPSTSTAPIASKDSDSSSKEKVKATAESEGGSDVSVTAVFKLPVDAKSDKVNAKNEAVLLVPAIKDSSTTPVTSASLLDFFKATSSPKNGTVIPSSQNENFSLDSKTSTQSSCTSVEPNQVPGILPLSSPVFVGSSGMLTLAQTSSTATTCVVSSSTSTFSHNIFKGVSTISSPYNVSVPPATNSTNSSSGLEEYIPLPSGATSFTFRSNKVNRCIGSPQSCSDVSSSVTGSSSVGGVMSSGYFSSKSSPDISSSTTQGFLDAAANTSAVGQPSSSSTNSSSGLFSFGIVNNSTSQSPFTFLDPKKSKASTDSTTGGVAPALGFSFSTSRASNSSATQFESTGTTQAATSLASTGFDNSVAFGSQIGSTASPVTAPPAYSASTALVTSPSPFGVSTASVTAPSPFGVSTASVVVSPPFGVTTASVTAPSPFSVSTTSPPMPPAFGVTTASVAVPSIFGVSTASVSSAPTFSSTAATVTSNHTSFSFGQTAGSQSTTTASASPFTFGSASTQGTSGPSSTIFQFGVAAAPAATVAPPQPFAPVVASTQNNTVTSSLFAFGPAAAPPATSVAPTTATATPLPFTFGVPKTNTSGQTFGTSTDTSVKAATPSGFSFNSVPTANTTTSAPVTGFSFGSPATTPASGFQFSSANTAPSANLKPNSPFTFGSSTNKAPSFDGASSTSSSFSFGGNTSVAPTFGSNPGQSFGGPSTGAPTFGTNTPSFGTATANPASPFGSTSAFGATSPNSSFTAPTFGTPNGTKTNSGANPFGVQGATPSFAASSNAAPAPTFGSTGGTGGFGVTQAPSFGTPSFGSDKTAADKGSTFQFGQGASNPPSFGAASPPTFGGATSPSTFGGATSPPTFGAGVSTTGASGGPVFQFGSNSTPSFNAGNNPGSVAPRRPRARAPRRHR